MIREKKASSGKVLTNGEAFSEVSGTVYLGCNDSEENWWEITEEEYNALLDQANAPVEQ